MPSDTVTISTLSLERAPGRSGTGLTLPSAQDASRTRFSELPLPARLLLAVPRTRGNQRKVPIAERYVLDTLGRVIDAGPDRRATIEAVNLLAEILLVPSKLPTESERPDPEWLTAVEDMVLCMLCKIQGGQSEEAANLARHWLDAPSVDAFGKAAAALCSADCFRRGGSQVFTPSWRGMPEHDGPVIQASVSRTCELSLAESLLLNSLRLRKRTLSHAGLGARVVPLLCQHAALPDLQAVVDALLVEFIRYSSRPPVIGCLCSRDLSGDEAIYLGSLTAMACGQIVHAERLLSDLLPAESVERLLGRDQEFAQILGQIGSSMPIRQWDLSELRSRENQHETCQHINEPAMIH